MSLIPFPNVPNVPGVPALLRSATVPSRGALLNNILGGVAQAIFGKIVWGVFDASGDQALFPDSFVSIDYQNGGRVSNAPQEKGAFSSYNKVANPYDCSVVMTIGADKAERTSFLKLVELMSAGTELFSVVTPEATYTNANLETFSYRRDSSKGVTLITVQLNFIQIRTTAKSTAASTAEPSGADMQNDGQVQDSEPTDDEVALAGATA